MNTSLDIKYAVPLSSLTTIQLGGKADMVVRCRNQEDIMSGLQLAEEKKLPWYVLGGGSNTIFPDEGFAGVILMIETSGMRYEDRGDHVLMMLAAGEEWSPCVDAAVAAGLGGIECLAGIPGRVGAIPIQNVGAYGQDTSQVLEHVAAIDTQTREPVMFSNEACEFGYRTSRFKTKDAGRYIVTEVVLRLRKHAAPNIQYDQVKALYHQRYGTSAPTPGPDALAGVRDIVLELRRQKSMVIDSHDPHSRSCGSFFTNPTVTADTARAVQNKLGRDDAGHAIGGGTIKLSAAALVEGAGFSRGQRFGKIGISPNHALALVNYGGTTHELLETARLIQTTVQTKFGIELAIEPVAVDPVHQVQ